MKCDGIEEELGEVSLEPRPQPGGHGTPPPPSGGLWGQLGAGPVADADPFLFGNTAGTAGR